MKISFIDKADINRRLILIFPGWSCWKDFYTEIRFTGWDVAVVENYEDLSLDSSPLTKYSTVFLFAWSLGVYMAEIADISRYITAAIALNGTLSPIDDKEGIPRSIYVGTKDNLSETTLLKFRKRMAGDSETFRKYFNRSFSPAEIDLLREQLEIILENSVKKCGNLLPWKKVFLSENDRIFPVQNMKRSWQSFKTSYGGNIELVSINGPHFVPLNEIIRFSIPDLERVSERFSTASSTYNENALAQRRLASLLSSHLNEAGMPSYLKILEIGPGTGLFTYEIIEKFHPKYIDFVDISSARPDSQGIDSTFYQADAEEWIAGCSEKYDAVLSSATVQWFVNLPLFIQNVAKVLIPEGYFGFSTFLPGNLRELDELRPSPIHYHSRSEIEAWMASEFDDVLIKEIDISLSFSSPSELFRHLRATGVGGSAPTTNIPLSAYKKLRNLTFRCGLFRGRKKSKIESTTFI